jgi:competence protein ComEA
VVDAVDAAGGVLPGADPGLLNLARVLLDGEQVLVGVEPPPGAVDPVTDAAAVADPEGRIDLNRASVADLDELPGVGPVLAERIVAHREKAGPFTGVEQLREVDGIGESRYAELQERVVVR